MGSANPVKQKGPEIRRKVIISYYCIIGRCIIREGKQSEINHFKSSFYMMKLRTFSGSFFIKF